MRMQRAFARFNFAVITLVMLFAFLTLKICYAQDEVMRIETDLVTIPATVLDREGRYITNLKKEDFRIFENGVEQETAFFESVDEPFTVFLLLDRSGSMTNHLVELANTASAFVSQLRHNDQIIAASFADDVDILVKVTKVSNLEKGIKIRKHFDDRYTRLYDAVEYTLEQMKNIRGRKAVIVFSDGAGSGIFASFKENIRDAEEGKALIYTVQFDTFSKIPPRYVSKKKFNEVIIEANTYMQQLAEVTGGRHFQVEDISNLEEKFAQVARELGCQYSLGYYPKTEGKRGERRQIKVKVRQPNLAVRARASYVIGSNK